MLTRFCKGSRGEWYLVVQAGLFMLLIFGPRSCDWLPQWPSQFELVAATGGGILFLSGFIIAAAGLFSLGRNMTPLPLPKENAKLVTTGAYSLVRHPVYSGIIFMASGWGLWLESWLTIAYALLFFIFFDMKSRLEEGFLKKKFPEYAGYCKHVRKLIPFVY